MEEEKEEEEEQQQQQEKQHGQQRQQQGEQPLEKSSLEPDLTVPLLELKRVTTPPGDKPQEDMESTASQAPDEQSVSEKLAQLQLQYQQRFINREGRKTIAEELDHKGRRDFRFTEADLDPTIIELQVLERGQYFGVTQMLFSEQPSLSVVSNGAECLVLSKKFFMQWASEKCLRHLRQSECPYPSDQHLGRKLQEMVNWQASRGLVYKELEQDVQRKQVLRKQFLPSYQGQYCFRTGPT